MKNYNDFDYVNYILALDIETAYKLFLSMKDREIKEIEQKSEDRAFLMYLKENKPGLKFTDYYDSMKKQAENSRMTEEDKDNEEQRILKTYSNQNINNLNRKEF